VLDLDLHRSQDLMIKSVADAHGYASFDRYAVTLRQRQT
jgi:hypothetical protein